MASEPQQKDDLPEKTQETERPAEVEPRDPNKVVVDLDDDPPALPAEGETQDSRRSKRAERRALKDELAQLRNQMAERDKELAELRGAVQARPNYAPQPMYQPAPAATPDPYENEIAGLSEQQQAINMAIANPKLDDARVQRLTDQWNKLERQKQELIIEKTMRRQGLNSQGQGGDRAFEMQVTMLQAQFPDVYSNPVSMKAADLEYTRMVHAGKPATFATAVEAAQRVRDQSNTRRPAPSEADKSRYTSVPSRAGGSPSASNQFVPTKQQLVNARAMYSHLDIPDVDKVRLWVDNVARPNGLVKNGA